MEGVVWERRTETIVLKDFSQNLISNMNNELGRVSTHASYCLLKPSHLSYLYKVKVVPITQQIITTIVTNYNTLPHTHHCYKL